MPTYQFADVETGEPVEAFFGMSEAPRIGDEVEIEGRSCVRVASFQTKIGGVEYPFTTKCLPKDVDLGCPRDKRGYQVFRSKAEEERVLKKTGYVREDPGRWGWSEV